MAGLGFKETGVVVDFEVGDTVVVTTGAWKDTVGVIESINEERQTLTIRVELFGRETPVELIEYMLNSNERMGFIIEYMSSYDEKIKMANKNGLFDAAKMFELFAIEVCNVWFGQKFSNLNDETATYPYVDLISENRELLVQVSTL